MPGTVTFKLIQAVLDREGSLLGKFDPYCKVNLGGQKALTHVCKKGGSSPEWGDQITFKKGDLKTCHLVVKDKSFIYNKVIGGCDINLEDLERECNKGRITKWYTICLKDKLVGQLQLEAFFEEDTIDISKPDLVDLNFDD